MAETSKKEIVNVCDCTTNGGMMMQRHMMHRMIFVLLVVMLAFWCGLKLGEIKGFMASTYGYGMHHRGGTMLYTSAERPMMMEKKAVPSAAEAPTPVPATEAAE
ncbi:MAG TPA: hypothetical protein VGE18_03530 [Candidatus Paceibacterota bacterium]